MATETMILRPSSMIAYSGTVYVTPSETPFEDWYKLINEEVADDSASYINIYCGKMEDGNVTTESSSVTFAFDYKQFGIISSGKIFLRISSGSPITSMVCETIILDEDKNEIIKLSTTFLKEDANYTNYEIDLSEIINNLNNISMGYIYITLFGWFEGNYKSSGINFTQAYIEFEYEKVEKFYIRQNSTWFSISGVFYIKQNGSWITTDSSILTNEQKFRINYIE